MARTSTTGMWLATTLALALAALPAAAQEKLKIGFITTLSGPSGVIGKHMKDSLDLALEHLGGKVGGLETEIVVGDDQQKPDVGLDIANKMVKSDRVQFVTGVIWSNVLMAIVGPVTKEAFLLSSNAGPSPLAGKECHENFFAVSWQNDQTPEAMGKHMSEAGVNDVYLIAPNYQAGKDMLSGFKRTFKGKIVEEMYVKLGQQDYQTELTQVRAANPKAVFVFLPGGMGINFLKQYDQAGMRQQFPLYNVYTADGTTLPAVKEAALGLLSTQTWVATLSNSVNRRYVEDFRKKFNYIPSFYGAQTYDTFMLLDAAIRKTGGKLADKKAIRDALRSVEAPNTRGSLKFNTNHFPIQNFYLQEVVKDAEGNFTLQLKAVVFSAHGDAYAKDCKMKQ